MQESSVTFSNFKGGLDTRRCELTSQPGVLLQLQDAHVNQGAEIENRWAFWNASYVPENSQGLEVAGSAYNNTFGQLYTGNGGLVTFGTGSLVTSTLTRARFGGVATLTISAAKPIYTFVVGDPVAIVNMGDANYNGTFILTSVAYATGNPNYYTIKFNVADQGVEATTADTGGALAWGYISWDSTISRAKSNGTVTLVLSMFPVVTGVANGNSILVQGVGGANYNGLFVVTSIKALNPNYQVTYQISDLSTEATTVDPGGNAYYSGYFTNNVYYQPFVHPAVQDGATFDATYHALTTVTASTSFGGLPWVSATYTDGNTFVFWGLQGQYVPAFRNGQVLNGWSTNQDIATQLANAISQVNLNGYTVGPVLAGVGPAFYFDVTSVPNTSYTLLTSVNSSVAGTISNPIISYNSNGTSGVAATASMIVMGGATGSVTSIQTSPDGATWTEILGAAVAFDSSNNQTATDIAAQISSYVSDGTFTAGAQNNSVVISGSVAAGAADNGLYLKATTSGDLVLDNVVFAFGGTWGATDDVTNVKYNSTGSTLVEILGSTQTYGSSASLSVFVATVATAISAYCLAHSLPYTAFAQGSDLFISRTICNSFVPVGTSGSEVIFDNNSGTATVNNSTANTLNVSASPSSINVPQGNESKTYNVTVSVSGGTSPYTYLWTLFTDANWQQYYELHNPTLQTCYIVINPTYSTTATLSVTVTDKNGNLGSVSIPIISL